MVLLDGLGRDRCVLVRGKLRAALDFHTRMLSARHDADSAAELEVGRGVAGIKALSCFAHQAGCKIFGTCFKNRNDLGHNPVGRRAPRFGLHLFAQRLILRANRKLVGLKSAVTRSQAGPDVHLSVGIMLRIVKRQCAVGLTLGRRRSLRIYLAGARRLNEQLAALDLAGFLIFRSGDLQRGAVRHIHRGGSLDLPNGDRYVRALVVLGARRRGKGHIKLFTCLDCEISARRQIALDVDQA